MIKQKVVGKVEEKQTPEGTQIEWKIPDFSFITEDESFDDFTSPKFTFETDTWTMRMNRRYFSKNPEIMVLYLINSVPREYSMEYSFGFKKLNNSVEQIGRGVFEERNQSIPVYIIKPSEVIQRKAELLPLTIVCILKRVNEAPPLPPALNESTHKNLIKLDILSKNFRTLFISKDSCDVTLRVKDKEHQAHKAVLIARSSVFAAMFLHDSKEKQTGVIDIPDCDSDSFKDFLEYLYCGKLEQLSSSTAFHLYETSDKYDVQELKAFCVEILMEELTVENLCDVVIMADKYDDDKLFAAAQTFFNRNASSVLVTSEWECFLKSNHRLANKLFLEMSLKVKDLFQTVN